MSEIKYTCPYCGKEFDITTYDSVHADDDPDLRERCISGDLFRYSCPHCKKDFMIQYPLVYSDREHQFVLWLSTQEVKDTLKKQAIPLIAQGYRLRRVATIQQLAEKIQIFEDSVSDVAVELAKFDSFIDFTENRNGKKEDITAIEYQRTKDDVMKINIRTDDKGMSFLIPAGSLQEELDQHKDRYAVDDSEFPLIDSQWMTELFQESAGKA